MEHTSGHEQAYRHLAHVLSSDGASAPRPVVELVRTAAEEGRTVVLACAAPLAEQLCAEVAGAGVVRAVEPPAVGRPPETVAAYAALVDRELPAEGRLLLVTSAESPAAGWTACLQTDALLNHVLAERPVDHLCLYPAEAASTGPAPADVARATHPELLTDAGVVRNDEFREPAELLRETARAVGPDPVEATEPTLSLRDLEDMRVLRRAVNRVLADSTLDPDAAQDFVLAIDEVTANAAEHGIPPVDVLLWSAPDRMVCAITDRGTCFDDPLAGYGPAHGDMAVGGMGLWLARRSVDSLTATPADEAGGCTIHLVVHAPTAPQAA